jgi:organic hydroperoxide reductase OsmC/OhrA
VGTTAPDAGGLDLGLADHVVELDHRGGYNFTARFVSESGSLRMDEPEPLGEGEPSGPEGVSLLTGGAAYCMTASLVFCLNKVRVPVEALSTRAVSRLKRIERRLRRIESLEIDIDVEVDGEHRRAFERCLGHFTEFCIVTESIQGTFPITIRVHHPWGEFERVLPPRQ